MGFWQNHSAKVFVSLFVLLSAVVLFLDIKATVLFGLTFEEEVFFPAIGILFLAFGLLVLKKKISGKSGVLVEWREMRFASKFFGLLSFFLIITAFILAIFQDLSLFNPTPLTITEEQIVAIGMLLSILAFIFIHSKEILAGE